LQAVLEKEIIQAIPPEERAMSYVFAVLVGTVIGMIAGFTITWVFDFSDVAVQLAFGGISGAIFGGLIGSFVGDANASGASRHQFLVACIFGIAGGMAGGTKLKVVESLMEKIGLTFPTL
jgi:hypothetical protein